MSAFPQQIYTAKLFWCDLKTLNGVLLRFCLVSFLMTQKVNFDLGVCLKHYSDFSFVSKNSVQYKS